MTALVEMAQTPVVFHRSESRKKTVRPPPKVACSDVTPNNLGTVRKLCTVLFPVSYSDKFFNDVLLPEIASYCQLVLYNDIPVGLLTSRLERIPDTNDARLYIATLGVLAPYRRQGLATRLLNHIIDQARASWTTLTPDPATAAPPPTADDKKKAKAAKPAPGPAAPAAPPPPSRIVGLKVHVQTSNTEAKAFWERQGFSVTQTLERYYTRIEPASAWVLELRVDDPTKEVAAVA